MARTLLPRGEAVEAGDAARGQLRFAILDKGRLEAALYISRSGSLPQRDWLIGQLEAAEPESAMALLAGRPARPGPDRGAILCVCFDVGLKQIIAAIADQALTSVEAVGTALLAGTNCGSCRPEIRRLLVETRAALS
jgi:assimilatory nitrate reductase catalytic subunit